MEQGPYVSEATCVLLNRLLPDFPIAPKQFALNSGNSVGLYLDLPIAPGAEYQFRLWVSPEIQISALLLDGAESTYFWFMPFAAAGWRTAAELQKSLEKTLETLVANETRIVQRRGLFFHRFKCEFKSPTGWKRVYAHSTLGFSGFQPPRIAERKRVYRSPALKLL